MSSLPESNYLMKHHFYEYFKYMKIVKGIESLPQTDSLITYLHNPFVIDHIYDIKNYEFC